MIDCENSNSNIEFDFTLKTLIQEARFPSVPFLVLSYF